MSEVEGEGQNPETRIQRKTTRDLEQTKDSYLADRGPISEVVRQQETASVLRDLREKYLAYRDQKLSPLEFGREFVDSLGDLQDLDVLNREPILKAVKQLGGLGREQPAIFAPLLEDLRDIYLLKKGGHPGADGEARKVFELVTLVGMDQVAGITGESVKQLRAYFESAGTFKEETQPEKNGHLWVGPHGSRAEATIPHRKDAVIGEIAFGQASEIGERMGIGRNQVFAADLDQSLDDLDKTPIRGFSYKEADQIAQRALTPEGVDEYKQANIDDLLSRLQAAVDERSGLRRGDWLDSRDAVLFDLGRETGEIIKDPRLTQYLVEKLFTLSKEARDLASQEISTSGHFEDRRNFLEAYKQEVEKRNEEKPEWLERYEYSLNSPWPDDPGPGSDVPVRLKPGPPPPPPATDGSEFWRVPPESGLAGDEYERYMQIYRDNVGRKVAKTHFLSGLATTGRINRKPPPPPPDVVVDRTSEEPGDFVDHIITRIVEEWDQEEDKTDPWRTRALTDQLVVNALPDEIPDIIQKIFELPEDLRRAMEYRMSQQVLNPNVSTRMIDAYYEEVKRKQDSSQGSTQESILPRNALPEPSETIKDLEIQINTEPIDEIAERYRELVRVRPEVAQEAIASLVVLVETHPKSAAVHRALGDAYMRAGRFQKAIDAYGRAVDVSKGGTE